MTSQSVMSEDDALLKIGIEDEALIELIGEHLVVQLEPRGRISNVSGSRDDVEE